MGAAKDRSIRHLDVARRNGQAPSEVPDSQYKRIFDALPPMFLILDPDFRMVAANDARFRGTLSSADQVIGKNVFAVFPDNPNDPAATGVANLRASLERVLAYRVPDRMAIQKYDIPRPVSEGGGFEERYWSPLNSPVLNEKGEVQYIIHQVEDVTEMVRLQKKESEVTAFNEQMKREIDERKRVEMRLRASEKLAHEERKKFEALFSEAPAAIALLRGPKLIHEKINPGYYAYVDHRDVLGKSIVEALPELEGSAVKDLLDEVFRTGETRTGIEKKSCLRSPEHRLGEEIYVDFSFQRIDDANGAPYGVFVHMVDVSDRVAARLKLEESEERFRSTFEQAAIGMAHVDLSGQWLRVNQKLCDIVGYSRDELMNLTFQDITHPDDLKSDLDLLARLSRHEINSYVLEKRYIHKNGTHVWVNITVAVSNKLPGIPARYIVAVEDISRRKNAELELARRQEELKRKHAELESERDIRERFVATLSHDLRNPLTAAKTTIQLVLRFPEKLVESVRLLSKAIRSLERADQMIQNLFDANRIRAGEQLPLHTSECDLAIIASEVLEEMILIHGNRFVLNSPVAVLGVWDCDGIRRILENLCTNAVKYGVAGKEITVTLKPEKERVCITIHNLGPAIPPEQQAKLFEPFQRTPEAQRSGQRGWGLGLSLVQGIAQAHGGSVSVTSTNEAGTQFVVSLPWNSRGKSS